MSVSTTFPSCPRTTLVVVEIIAPDLAIVVRTWIFTLGEGRNRNFEEHGLRHGSSTYNWPKGGGKKNYGTIGIFDTSVVDLKRWWAAVGEKILAVECYQA